VTGLELCGIWATPRQGIEGGRGWYGSARLGPDPLPYFGSREAMRELVRGVDVCRECRRSGLASHVLTVEPISEAAIRAWSQGKIDVR
jgi:hypothetical protein